ncbi:MAG: type II/IV secretion system ATPase subunit [Desulfurococcales archaeon]|nr:type II/IV secretion system ATPase subunit [Desulfurococcales archaeon]
MAPPLRRLLPRIFKGGAEKQVSDEVEDIDTVVERELKERRKDIEAARSRKELKLEASYNIIEDYVIEDPWARVLILEDKNSGSYVYFVDELEMTPEERRAYERIMEILNWELKPLPPTPTEEVKGVERYEWERDYFIGQIKRIVSIYRIRFGGIYPQVSWGKILYYITRDTIGYGPIHVLMKDSYIEDISCDGVGRPIYVWHQKYESLPTNIVFSSDEELDKLVLRLVHKAGRHVSVAFPIVDAILPEGHRLAVTFKREVSTSGSTFTIRKFKEKPLSIIDLIDYGTLSSYMAAYLWIAMDYKMPGIIMGVTGSGKTTTLNAIATLFRPNIKIVTIEDTPELKLPHKNWVQLASRPSYGLGVEKIGEVTLYDLVKVSLRYRPDVIIVGEVRGEEAYVLFQAMATGHGGLTTIHSEDVEAMVKRLTSPPMNIPPSYIPLLKFALAIKRVRILNPDGSYQIARRITNLWEIVDYGVYREVARWNPYTKEHEHEFERSHLLSEVSKLAGVTFEDLINDLERRRIILEWMRIAGIRSYDKVAEVIFRYYMNPEKTYERAVKELEAYRI